MRLFILVSFVAFASSFSFASMAQDKAADTKPPKTQSIEDTAKRSDKDRTEKVDAEDESFDLDSFFKTGEDNAKNGHGCERPPEPIS